MTPGKTRFSGENERPIRGWLKEFRGGIRDRLMITAVRIGERVFGPAALPLILLPWITAEIVLRARDYRQFRRLRASLPPGFWRGTGSLRHYLRMIADWQRSLALCLLADRFKEARWCERVQVHGTPPNRLADWGKRPIVLVCLHTGGFVLLRHWMRENGMAAASLVTATPAIIRRYEERLRARGANRQRSTFHVSDVRAAVRFLKAGNVLVVALDARKGAHNVTMGAPFRANEGAVRLARLTQATLLPASVWLKKRGEVEIRFGRPVPHEMVECRDSQGTVQFLAAEFWKDLAHDSCSIGWTTLEAYAPEHLMRSRRGWP